MEAGKVFLIFFVFFTVATLAVPVPLFPGNMTTPLFGSLDISLDSPLVNALVNGAFYGFVVWIVFVSVGRKLEEPEAPINPNTHVHSTEGHVSCPVRFGYLRELPSYSSVLEECYSCTPLEQCLNG